MGQPIAIHAQANPRPSLSLYHKTNFNWRNIRAYKAVKARLHYF